MNDGELEARWQKFWHDHEEYDPVWPRHILGSLSEFLPFLFAFDALPQAIEVLYTGSGVEIPSDLNWTEVPDYLDITELHKLPISRLALALRAYAYYGILHQRDEHDVVGLDEFLDQIDGGTIPTSWFIFAGDDETRRTIAAALGRSKLDRGGDLTVEELAALAKVTEKTIMNLVAPNTGSGLWLGKGKLVPRENARNWLLNRPDFRPSILHQQKGGVPEPTVGSELSGDPVFVPATQGDLLFSPVESRITRRNPNDQDTKRRSYYSVGDENFEDYWEALDALHWMEPPTWRQPDTAGRAREKVGKKWVRKVRQELEDMLASVPDDTSENTD